MRRSLLQKICTQPKRSRCREWCLVAAKKVKEEEKEIDVLKHSLVPEHAVLKQEEIAELLKRFNITIAQLPKVYTTDPAVKAIGAKEGDVLKIERRSQVAGTTPYYRLVIKG